MVDPVVMADRFEMEGERCGMGLTANIWFDGSVNLINLGKGAEVQ